MHSDKWAKRGGGNGGESKQRRLRDKRQGGEDAVQVVVAARAGWLEVQWGGEVFGYLVGDGLGQGKYLPEGLPGVCFFFSG